MKDAASRINTEGDIGAAIERYAVFLCNEIWENEQQDSAVKRDQLNDVVLSCVVYYIVVDRILHQTQSPEQRVKSSQKILQAIVDALAGRGDKTDAEYNEIANLLNESIAKLAPYGARLSPIDEGSPAGTLYWEFAKLIHGEEVFAVTSTSIAASTVCKYFITEIGPLLQR